MAAFRSYALFMGQGRILAEYSSPKPAPSRPRALKEGMTGIRRMIEVAENDNELSIAVLCGLIGLRISEARSVRPSHISLDENHPILRVRGKGDKDRDLPIGKVAWGLLEPIYNKNKASNDRFVQLADRMARLTWKRLAARAEISKDSASHDGRATMATSALRRGANVRTVQKILGHTSLDTTQSYLDADMRDMSKALEI